MSDLLLKTLQCGLNESDEFFMSLLGILEGIFVIPSILPVDVASLAVIRELLYFQFLDSGLIDVRQTVEVG